MSVLKKVGNIIEGFTSSEPVGKDWYEMRMSKCKSCVFNSDNIEREKLTEVEKLKLETICIGDFLCTACGCCGSKKARVPDEVCGKVKLGLEPEWGALSIESPVDENLKVSTSDTQIRITNKDKKIYLIRKFKEEEKVINFTLFVEHKKHLKVISVEAGCSCTVAEHVEETDKKSKVDLSISTRGFRGDASERTVLVRYFLTPSKSESLNIVLRFERYE